MTSAGGAVSPLIGKFSTARARLPAVVGVGRDTHLAERIAFDAVAGAYEDSESGLESARTALSSDRLSPEP